MSTYRRLLFGGSVLLIVGLATLALAVAPRVTADIVCVGGLCSATDSTVSEFVQGQFYATGLRNVGDGEVQLLPRGLTSLWSSDVYTLPQYRRELAAVIYRDIIYVIGGADRAQYRPTEIYSATTYITGPIKSPGWTIAGYLPNGLSGMAAVISTTQAGGYLYVLGGSTGAMVTNTVSYRAFDTNGSFTGAWQTARPMSETLVYHQAVVHNGHLYLVGGNDGTSSGDSQAIYRAPINADGSLGAWVQEANSLLQARSSFGAVTWQKDDGTTYLYALGGQSGGSSNRISQVNFASFAGDGSLNAFAETGTLPESLTAHGTVQGSGQIFVSGGQKGIATVPITDVHAALIDSADGTLLGPPNAWIVSQPLPNPRHYHASVMNSGGEVYVIAGYGAVTDPDPLAYKGTNTIYHGSTSGFGSSYAPAGKYTSRPLNLTTKCEVSEIVVNTTITSPVTMTVQYRYGDSVNDLLAASWNNLPGGLAPGVDISNTFAVTPTASYIQYQAFFTSTSPYTLSPALNAFQVKYRLPSDLIVTNITPQNVQAGQPATVTVAIKNQGTGPARPLGASLRRVTGVTRGGLPLRAPAAPSSSYYFWVDVYIDPSSSPKRDDPGNCYASGQDVQPGQTINVPVPNCVFATLGVHTVYAQVDTCVPDDPDYPGCLTYGHIWESIETNNIFSTTVDLSPTPNSNLYLPLILKGQ